MIRRIAKWISLGGLGLLIVGAIAGWLWHSAFLFGWFIPKMMPAELAQKLDPHMVYTASANGEQSSDKTVILFHGCAGPETTSPAQWGAFFRERGWSTLDVNSTAARGHTYDSALATVCEGSELLGGERAGDVAVAIDHARQFSPGGDILLMGSSHGGWSIMDLMAAREVGRLPTNLSAMPASFSTLGVSDIKGIFMMYPYCGLGTWTTEAGWTDAVPTLFVMAENDTVVDTAECAERAAWLKTSGISTSFHVVKGVDHVFELEGFNTEEFPYSEQARLEAENVVAAWVNSL